MFYTLFDLSIKLKNATILIAILNTNIIVSKCAETLHMHLDNIIIE